MYQSKPHAPDDYPQRVQQLLDQLGLTRTQFAQRLGVTTTTVRNWETGLAKPSSELMATHLARRDAGRRRAGR